MPNTFQYLYFNKIIDVIKSCETFDQLENTQQWFDNVTLINNLPARYADKIMKTYRAKKQQIQNGLAAKYN